MTITFIDLVGFLKRTRVVTGKVKERDPTKGYMKKVYIQVGYIGIVITVLILVSSHNLN